MKPNELRIGNYIYEDDGILAKVIGFSPYDHSVRCDEKEGCNILIDLYPKNGSVRMGYETDSICVNPVPLTEEWLIRFGFENHAKSDVFNAWSIGINPITHDYLFDIVWMKNGKGELTDSFYRNGHFQIKYVHQLQNLYFALTGEELTIKDNATNT